MHRGFGFHDRHSPFRFDPATLFIGGAIKGAFYDPSNITTLFQDDAGTTPVAAAAGVPAAGIPLVPGAVEILRFSAEAYFSGKASEATTVYITPGEGL